MYLAVPRVMAPSLVAQLAVYRAGNAPATERPRKHVRHPREHGFRLVGHRLELYGIPLDKDDK